jgi:hypothetical protein
MPAGVDVTIETTELPVVSPVSVTSDRNRSVNRNTVTGSPPTMPLFPSTVSIPR